MKRLAAFGLVGLLLLALAAPVAAEPATEFCPNDQGNPGKVESVVSGDLNDVVLDAGTIFCVKAGTRTTGLQVADGEQTLCEVLQENVDPPILDGSGETCRDVSHYIVYGDEPPEPGLFSVETCPETGEPVLAGESLIRFNHPVLLILLLTIRIDGQIVTLSDTLGDGTVGDAIVAPGLHTWSISNFADTEVLASGEILCPECNPTTASVPPSVKPSIPNTAMNLPEGSPLALLAMLITSAGFAVLAGLNVRNRRQRLR